MKTNTINKQQLIASNLDKYQMICIKGGEETNPPLRGGMSTPTNK